MSEFVNQELYETISKMSRADLERYLEVIFNMGVEAAVDKIDFDELRGNIGEISGMNDELLDDTMTVVQNYFDTLFYYGEE